MFLLFFSLLMGLCMGVLLFNSTKYESPDLFYTAEYTQNEYTE